MRSALDDRAGEQSLDDERLAKAGSLRVPTKNSSAAMPAEQACRRPPRRSALAAVGCTPRHLVQAPASLGALAAHPAGAPPSLTIARPLIVQAPMVVPRSGSFFTVPGTVTLVRLAPPPRLLAMAKILCNK